MKKIYGHYIRIKSEYLVTRSFTVDRLEKMHDRDKLAGYIERIEHAYNRIDIKNQKQALNILKVNFHNQNQLGALNEELSTKKQKAGTGYVINCCIGNCCNSPWSSVRRSTTTVDRAIAEYVRDRYQVLEIDRIGDGESLFAVLEHKDLKAEYAHNLFWSYYVNNEYRRARNMAIGMKPVWRGQLADYYDKMYHRLLYK